MESMTEKEKDKARNEMSKMSMAERGFWLRYIKENCPIPEFYKSEFAYYMRIFRLKQKGIKFKK